MDLKHTPETSNSDRKFRSQMSPQNLLSKGFGVKGGGDKNRASGKKRPMVVGFIIWQDGEVSRAKK